MPWGAVAGAAIGAIGSAGAAKDQKDAANAANQLQKDMYDSTVTRNQPFLTAGTDALASLQQKLPYLNSGYDPSKLTSEPGYMFGLQQGQQALERSLAAKGRGVSGAALKAAAQYGTNYGTTKLNDAFNRDLQSKNQQFSQLSQLAGMGQASANNTSAAGQNYGQQAGQNIIGAGNSAAANDIAQGNIWGGLVNQGVSAYKNSGSGFTPSGGGGSWASTGGGSGGWGSGDAYGNQDQGQFLADGGPVRAEPKVGTRGPVRGGGGGGMSRDAILAQLMAAHQEGPVQGDIGGLPANPVTQPGAILDARMRTAGAYARGGPVQGPGGPRDDLVPANLSDGEHVVDAETVSALGDGDNERGQALLNEMRQRIKAHAKGKKRSH